MTNPAAAPMTVPAGTAVPAAAPIAVRNPWTGEHDHQITPPTRAELAETCGRLRASQVAWAAAPLDHRIEVLRAWADRLEASAGALAAADSVDTGYGTISKLSPGIVTGAVRGWCADAPQVLADAARSGTSSVMPSVSFRSQLVPYPLLGVIIPWNAPLMLSLLDAIPALVAGCAVVVKPSEVAPRFVGPLMATITADPELAGILTYVNGDGRTGQDLIDQVDVVCFTGSVATGRTVAEACARRLIPAYLELGGKDPAVVTASADPEAAATAVLRGAVWGTGQVCFAIERVYVHEALHDPFVDALVRQAGEVTLNHPDREAGDIGPFGPARQAAVVDAHLDDALAKGAVLRAGGHSERHGGGLFMRPVVLTGMTHDMTIMQEETFGPVMPVMAYRTEDEAVALANDSAYGLSAAVIAGTAEEAARIGERLNAGTVSLQDTFLTLIKVRDVGTDSFGDSGLGGHRTGPGSILRFVRSKALLTNRARPASLRGAAGR